MTRPIRRAALAAAVSLLAACATAVQKDYSSFRASNPRSILIVPPVNESIAVDAQALSACTLSIPIAERGYYVFPVNMVTRVLEDDGLADANLVHQADPARLAALFGADAILYVKVKEWTAKYFVLQTNVEVELEYVIRDGRTGQEIWSEHVKRAYASGSSQSSGSLVADLIVAAVAAAATKAAPNYMPLAKQASADAILTAGVGLPPGPYHEEYQRENQPAR